jgi:glycosyltransferase involved in cell wall biosynthesis
VPSRSIVTHTPIWWTGPLEDGSGYAVEGRLLVRGLRERHALRAESVQQGLLPRIVERAGEGADDACFAGGTAAHIAHLAWADPFPHRPSRGVFWRTMFETDSLPAGWAERANSVEQVWVPSSWNVGTFAGAGVERHRLRVLHSPLDPIGWHTLPRRPSTHGGEVVFLSVFTWALRKGWDVLLTAYFEEFTRTDPVVLILRADPFLFGGSDDPVAEQLERFVCDSRMRRRPRVRIVDQPLPEPALRTLYRSADAFVLPSRGEGWGRPLMEAKAAGLPVVTTDWGGQTEFVDPELDYLLDYELAPVDDASAREYALFAGHRWAEPSVAHLRTVLRRLVVEGDRVSPALRDAHAADVRARFAYTRVARRASELLAGVDTT